MITTDVSQALRRIVIKRKAMIPEKVIRKPEVIQLFVAFVALIMGSLTYLLDRKVKASFVPDQLFSGGGFIFLLGSVGNHLPSFSHTFAFTLFTTAVLWTWPRYITACCVIWFIIEALLELGQYNIIAAEIGRLVPIVFYETASLEVIPRYFLDGTFDYFDLLSIALGSICAYFVVQTIKKMEGSSAKSN